MKLEIEKASNGYIITLPAENEEHIEQKIVVQEKEPLADFQNQSLI